MTPRGLPEWGTVNAIELSAHQPGRAFLAVHRYRLDDFAPYIFRTSDWGASWETLTDGKNGIPAGQIALQRMPNGAPSMAAALVSWCTAPLVEP